MYKIFYVEKLGKNSGEKRVKGGVGLVVWSDRWGDRWPAKVSVEHLTPRRTPTEVESEALDDRKSGRTTEDNGNE